MADRNNLAYYDNSRGNAVAYPLPQKKEKQAPSPVRRTRSQVAESNKNRLVVSAVLIVALMIMSILFFAGAMSSIQQNEINELQNKSIIKKEQIEELNIMISRMENIRTVESEANKKADMKKAGDKDFVTDYQKLSPPSNFNEILKKKAFQ